MGFMVVGRPGAPAQVEGDLDGLLLNGPGEIEPGMRWKAAVPGSGWQDRNGGRFRLPWVLVIVLFCSIVCGLPIARHQ